MNKEKVERLEKRVSELIRARQYAAWVTVDENGRVVKTDRGLPLPPDATRVKTYVNIGPDDWD